MSSLQFEMMGHDVKLSNYQVYCNIVKFSWKMNAFSHNTSGRRLTKTRKTKENLGYIFASIWFLNWEVLGAKTGGVLLKSETIWRRISVEIGSHLQMYATTYKAVGPLVACFYAACFLGCLVKWIQLDNSSQHKVARNFL